MDDELYSILQEAADMAGDGDVRRCYHLLNIVLHRAVDMRTAGSRIHFGGLFAKIDHLTKKHSLHRSLAEAIGSLRSRLREKDTVEEGILRWAWQQDVEALAMFIASTAEGDGTDATAKNGTDAATDVRKSIPQKLRVVFPREHRTFERSIVIGDSMRMVVEKWDDTFIYGQTEELGDTIVCYDLKTDEAEGRYYAGDWTYIRKLLSEGCLLNLVRPRQKDNVVYPELIIFQPDFLVDITSIASCFESYAELPYVALFNRLKTVYPTKAIHLGNLASQFLDEEIHDSNATYAESVMHFFRHNALDMAAADGLDATFHDDAKRQRENIHLAVREALEKEVGHFDASLALLEPSFFCEMLGLHGRMDLLQKDYKVLIEQKSGKGDYAPGAMDPEVPKYHEKHYVQMLLYMAALHYGYKSDGQPMRNSDIQSFLLYSKYRKGLVRLGAAPELLFRAIMLRNQITWCELSYTHGGADILLKMTPEMLLRKPMSEKFWKQWIRPQLADILSPIQDASPLEQKYFLRMIRFVAQEHVLSKMGSNTKENSGFASKWHDTLADKLLAGNIFAGLDIQELMYEENAVVSVLLTVEADDNVLSTNYRRGDIVVLYAYEALHDPDVRKTMVHRGSLEDVIIADGVLTLKVLLRSPQTDGKVFKVRKGWKWAVEHDFYESSSTALYRSLHQFLKAPVHRRMLILGQRRPETDRDITLCGDYGAFNELVRGAMQARDLFMVIGPPGTGKTSFGLMNILREQTLRNPQSDILLMSYTNRAVDEICSKLVAPDDGSEPYDFVRVGGRLSCDPAYRDHLLEERCHECRNITEIKELIARTHIYVGTTTSMTSAAGALFRLKQFDLAVIDEASQILEPHLIGLLSATDGIDVAIRRFVLIGDHKQLPAVVQQPAEDSRVEEPELRAIGLTDCRNSLFERMLSLYGGATTDGQPAASYMLRNQGRMHPMIADFPNAAFYDSQLGIAGLPHQLDDTLRQRVTFIPVDKPLHSPSDKVNEAEAEVIAQVVHEAYQEVGDAFNATQTVGVIVPYRNQITAVRKALDKYGIPVLHDITIDTVERYQGSQREVIVYGFTVQYTYQLAFLAANTFYDEESKAWIDRKLNVAMTRARRREVLVGNPEVLRHNDIFRRMLEQLM